MNTSKCELYFLPRVTENQKQKLLKKINDMLPGIKVPSENELVLLGAPLTESAVNYVLEEKMQTLEIFFKKLSVLQPHFALFLLQHCLWKFRWRQPFTMFFANKIWGTRYSFAIGRCFASVLVIIQQFTRSSLTFYHDPKSKSIRNIITMR